MSEGKLYEDLGNITENQLKIHLCKTEEKKKKKERIVNENIGGDKEGISFSFRG